MLWNVCENKFDDASRAIYDIITDLSKILPSESLEILFGKISQIPQEKCDDVTINLIKDYSINALNTINSGSGTSCRFLLFFFIF